MISLTNSQIAPPVRPVNVGPTSSELQPVSFRLGFFILLAAMKTPRLFPALLAITVLLTANNPALACTGGALVAKDGRLAVGRTLEFGQALDSVLAVWPAGSEFTGTTSTGANGLK